MIARSASVLLILLTFTQPSRATEASIEFDWADGGVFCKRIIPNPRIVIKNFPPDTKRVLLTLTSRDRENGGQEIDLPSTGIIPAGAISTLGICKPGTYRWDAVFKSASGAILGEAHIDKYFSQK